MPEQTPEEYAREKLIEYLVAKGIERGLAKRHIEERINEFNHVTIDGRRILLVKYEDRLWPTFNEGLPNPWAKHLADELYSELDSPYASGMEGKVRSAL